MVGDPQLSFVNICPALSLPGVILFYSVPFKDTNPIAHALLDEFKTFNNVINASYDDLVKVKGVGEHTAMFFNALHQSINIYYKNMTERKYLSGTAEACEFCRSLFIGKQYEEFYMICLRNANEIINYKRITNNDPSKVDVSFKTLISFADNNHSTRVILCHNHPNGKSAPSDEDIKFTSKMLVGLTFSEIEVLDHIIVSPTGVYSMADSGQLYDLTKNLTNNRIIKYLTANNKAEPFNIDGLHGNIENL